ncbi:MAG: formate/nitrite transporter family protein [Bacteroidaceae bacterium]|nr:formate/nitrite transporter family protein [Bacteroidaceae bacterium]
MSTTYSLSANTFRSSILSGIAVGIAGWGYLACRSKGLEILGAVLFSFGLLTVVNYKLKLYTGTAGFVSLRKEDGSCRFFRAIAELLFILLGNITGCMLVALLLRCLPISGLEQAQAQALHILDTRLTPGPLKAGALAIGCGFIMTTVVTFAREGKPLALLFGVPLFIYCGFPHCLADAFYYMAAPLSRTGEHLWEIVALYPCLVIGNFIGCNLYRFLAPKE